MNKTVAHVVFLVVMIAVIIAIDTLFFRHQFWPRLLANIGIVFLAIAFYIRFFK